MNKCDKCNENLEIGHKMRIEHRKGTWYYICRECSEIYTQGILQLEALYHDLFFRPDRLTGKTPKKEM